MQIENPAWLSLGSNLGDGRQQLSQAWHRLGELPGICLDVLSNPWLSSPVEMTSKHWFTNAVGRVQTLLTPQELFYAMQVMESDFGRKKDAGCGYQDRTLDLDLLYYGANGAELVTNGLNIPHPKRMDRLFVLKPLQEIEPNFFDVHTGKSVSTMIHSLEANLQEGEQHITVEQWS